MPFITSPAAAILRHTPLPLMPMLRDDIRHCCLSCRFSLISLASIFSLPLCRLFADIISMPPLLTYA